MADTPYSILTAAAAVTPEQGEHEQDFLKRLLRAVDKLDETAFNALPKPEQEWFNDAVLAVQNKNPIAKLPGAPFTDADPEPANAAPATTATTTTAEPPAGESAGADTPATPKGASKAPKGAAGAKEGGKAGKTPKPRREEPPAPAAAPKGGRGKGKGTTEAATSPPKPAAAAAKSRKPASNGSGRGSGVLDALMAEALADPKANPKQLKARVEEKYKMQVKPSNATGIHQQFRRVVRFLQKSGELKRPILVD